MSKQAIQEQLEHFTEKLKAGEITNEQYLASIEVLEMSLELEQDIDDINEQVVTKKVLQGLITAAKLAV